MITICRFSGYLLQSQVWRLLAETQMLQGDAAAAGASYETADSKAGGSSIELLSAWTDALLAAGKPQKVRSRLLCHSAVADRRMRLDLLTIGASHSCTDGTHVVHAGS